MCICVYVNVYTNLFIRIYFNIFTVIDALHPLKINRNGYLDVNPETMESSERGLFAGGDIAGYSETTVEAVNDGKTAAWYMHCYIQVIYCKIKYSY